MARKYQPITGSGVSQESRVRLEYELLTQYNLLRSDFFHHTHTGTSVLNIAASAPSQTGTPLSATITDVSVTTPM